VDDVREGVQLGYARDGQQVVMCKVESVQKGDEGTSVSE